LPPEHNHRIGVDHVQAYEPNLLLSHYMYDLPVPPLCVQLLNGCSVCKCLIADCVNISLSECAAVGSSHSL
jgi:hypothetical protein